MNVASNRHSEEKEEASRVPPSLPPTMSKTTVRSVSTTTKTAAAVVSGEPGFSPAHAQQDEVGVIAAPAAETTKASDDDNEQAHHIPLASKVEEEDSNSNNSSSSSSNSNNKPDTTNAMNNSHISNNDPEEEEEVNVLMDENEDDVDDESEYEYEDDDDAAFSGFLVGSTSSATTAAAAGTASTPARIEEEGPTATSAAPSEVEPELDAAPKKKWREPTRAAVSMSLRAQQETSGSKRRLAQDLYRIMNQDTEEAGFSLAPKSEDSMELWTIKLFQFDEDSNLAKDMMVLGIDHIELEMKFPEQYPFEPPFVRVVKPRFKRQTGFVMNGALCMELLTNDGWNPINDIESVIVSIRSLLVVGDGRLQAAAELSDSRYMSLLKAAQEARVGGDSTGNEPNAKKARLNDGTASAPTAAPGKGEIGSYTAAEALSAYSHLSDYHKKKGWDTSGWWARKG